MYSATYKKYKLLFRSPSGTSRGILTEKDSWFIIIRDTSQPGLSGIGECSLLNHLSIDYLPDYEAKIRSVCSNINLNKTKLFDGLYQFPSIRFGLETAFLDIEHEGKKDIFPSRFTSGDPGISINGLIWMGSIPYMKEQLKKKIENGFSCIKIKIGALNFEEELTFLRYLRKEYGQNIEIRLDANGAFEPDDTVEKLKRLNEYNIHSIEQPIRKGQIAEMAYICRNSPVPVALDEELTGVLEHKQLELLEQINPRYIILKPSLLGGFAATDRWAENAMKLNINMWITSALESNIGLNAIAQYAFTKNPSIPQGLGTGSLFRNNFPSPLEVRNDHLYYNPQQHWQTDILLHV